MKLNRRGTNGRARSKYKYQRHNVRLEAETAGEQSNACTLPLVGRLWLIDGWRWLLLALAGPFGSYCYH